MEGEERIPGELLERTPNILTLPLKPKRNALFQHKGEEVMLVLEGTMKLFHGEKEFIVEEGD